MSASKAAKSYGHKTLTVVSRFYGIHADTLNDWYTTKPKLFEAACQYAAQELNGEVDYRLLLTKYMGLVAVTSGITYLDQPDFIATNAAKQRFTEQEWNILNNIASISE